MSVCALMYFLLSHLCYICSTDYVQCSYYVAHYSVLGIKRLPFVSGRLNSGITKISKSSTPYSYIQFLKHTFAAIQNNYKPSNI